MEVDRESMAPDQEMLDESPCAYLSLVDSRSYDESQRMFPIQHLSFGGSEAFTLVAFTDEILELLPLLENEIFKIGRDSGSK